MPIVVPPLSLPVVTIENWVLDGLQLTTGAFTLMQLTADPPKERQDWITAADTESAALFRQPKHENRVISMKLRVTAQTNMDMALDQVAALIDKLRKASSTTGGIGLAWTPTDSTRTRTFTVLTGEITGLPIAIDGDGLSWVLNRPIVSIDLTCQPYWVGAEVLTSTNSSSTPFNAFEIAGVTGDIPALGRLIITDTATQSRRHVEWGLEGPLTYNSATSLLIDSDNMVTTGFSGVQGTAAGSYDPNASGNNIIRLSPIAGATTAMCGTGDLSHVGVFLVKARGWSDATNTLFRLSWKAGDGPINHNDWVKPPAASGWVEMDLGTITVPATTLGTQRWTGQIEVQGDTVAPGSVLIDYLILVPQADGYGKARASWSYSQGVLVAYDTFTGTTAGSALNTRVAPLGGTWATSGDATDFVFSDNMVGTDGVESLSRIVSVSETTGRIGILGSTSYTDSEIDARVEFLTYNAEMSLILRWVDSSNFLRLRVKPGTLATASVVLEQVVAGVATTLASPAPGALALFVPLTFRFRLIAYSSGTTIATAFSDDGSTIYSSAIASSTALATGGTLATGKPGINTRNTTTINAAHHWDDIAVYVPAAEPIAIYSGKSMQVRYDDTLRQDSTGTYYGRSPSYRGSRFLLPVGTSRVLVKARRNDVDAALDDQVTDAVQAQVGWTPRGLAVPR